MSNTYRKMHRKHRKELVRHAKETCEWDWEWFHESVIMRIRHMYEYYTCGDNVWQADESRLPVVEQLQYVLNLDKEIKNLEEEYKSQEEYYKLIGMYEELYRYIGKHMHGWWD